MKQTRSILQALMFALLLALGGIGTAAAGDTATGQGISTLGGPGSDRVVRGCDGDKDDG